MKSRVSLVIDAMLLDGYRGIILKPCRYGGKETEVFVSGNYDRYRKKYTVYDRPRFYCLICDLIG